MINRIEPTFVIVGAGGISRSYAQAFVQGLPYQLVGVADIRIESAREVAAMVDAPAYDNVDQMVDDLKPTAAIVCTPPSTHPEVCIRLMEQGVHVLCEKPLAISTEEAIRMAETAERCHVVFSMGSKFRFVADVQKTREIIDSGILGDIILYENTFAGFCDMSKRWNSQPAISGGGVLIDNGTHSVDILRFLLGNITELQVVEGTANPESAGRRHGAPVCPHRKRRDGKYRSVMEPEQGPRRLHQPVRIKGDSVRRLERIQIQTG